MGKALQAFGTWASRYRKTIAALAGVGVIVLDDVATSTTINWQTIIIAAAAALGVYAVPNTPPAAPTL